MPLGKFCEANDTSNNWTGVAQISSLSHMASMQYGIEMIFYL